MYCVQELTGLGIDMTQRESLTAAVYDQLVSSILRILERLDLSSNQMSTFEEQEVSSVWNKVMYLTCAQRSDVLAGFIIYHHN